MKVLEYTLRVSGDALMNGDFNAFSSIFHLPHHISTFEGNTTIRTLSDLEAVFRTVTKRLASMGATAIVRQCVAAVRKVDNVIEATHTTRILSGARQVGETSSAFSVLELFDGIWLGTSSQYAFSDDMNLNRALIICTADGAQIR